MNDNRRIPHLLGIQNNLSMAAALSPDSEGYLGRRVEADGSWTMYHVFTGIPARIGHRIMVGLTKAEATAAMVRRNSDRTVK